MENLLDTLKSHAESLVNETKKHWHHLHANPELSFNEEQTSLYVYNILKKNNITAFKDVNGKSIIGIIEGKHPGKTIGIRAELDALPITENTNLDFSSINKGVMHACGHDIHMASLLGTSVIINRLRDSLNGKILLAFESGEEQLPGGAKQIIDSKIFQNNLPDVMLAFHVLPEIAAGKAGFKEGQYMASGDEVYITVKGKGGHAALPHTTINPIMIASQLLLNLKDVIEKETPQQIPTILSFGKINGNGATNVIPNIVNIEGTFRTMEEVWRKKAHKLISRISKETCKNQGGDCEVEIKKGYPSIYNNPELTRKVKELSKQFLGASNVTELDGRMTTDDFAYFSQSIPSVFFRMGVGFNDGKKYQLHNTELIVNEEVLKYSSGLMAWISMNLTK